MSAMASGQIGIEYNKGRGYNKLEEISYVESWPDEDNEEEVAVKLSKEDIEELSNGTAVLKFSVESHYSH